NPQFLFITASANNDNLTAPLGAAIVAAAVLVATRPDWRRVALLGLLLGLSALTKLALLALWPVAFVALLPAVWPLRRDWRAAGRYLLPRVAVLLVLPLLIAGWWYVRAQRLYGDPLVWDVHLSAKFDSIVRLTPFTWADLGDFFRLHFQSYWATFGWLNVQPPPAVFWLLGLLLTAGLLGLALTVWRRRGEQTAVNIAALLLN